MRTSLNETEALVRKALVGVGKPHGVAQDLARAAAALLLNGSDGVAAAAHALQTAPAPSTVLDTSLSVFDGLAGGGEARLDNVDAPLFLVGVALVMSADYRLAVQIKFPSGAAWEIDSGSIATVGGSLAGILPSPPITADLHAVTRDKSSPSPLRPYQRVEIDDDAWAYLQQLAALTLVPDSETSRQGAGAEDGIDNE